MKKVNMPHQESQYWTAGDCARLKTPFYGADRIEKNFSQAWQDIWVLQMTRGKRGGKYLEVGANHPINNNNTFLLSSKYGWKGISIEYDPIHLKDWFSSRPNDRIVFTDAMTVDYESILESLCEDNNFRIDYLQLDIEPSFNTLTVLKALPLKKYRFSTITFETDAYLGDFRARDESRSILLSHGYVPVIEDVLVNFAPASPNPIPFEDWWIDKSFFVALGFDITQSAKFCFPTYVIFRP